MWLMKGDIAHSAGKIEQFLAHSATDGLKNSTQIQKTIMGSDTNLEHPVRKINCPTIMNILVMIKIS